MELAHIAIFAYNRPHHLTLTIEHLLKNNLAKYSDVTFFCDGPKINNDLKEVEEVREIVNGVTGFKNKNLVFSQQNMGLSSSIINGVSSILKSQNSIIVLEDDIVVSNNFLDYMNSNLSNYEHNLEVASIHAYCYPIKNLPDYFFLKGADCWGWGTWKRSWDLIELDGKTLLHKLNNNGLYFNMLGGYNYIKMLKNQIAGKNDSWAIRWHASMYILNKLTLYPSHSLVKNIGNDGTGTNFKKIDRSFDTEFVKRNNTFNKIKVTESKKAYFLFVVFFYKRNIKKVLQILNHRLRKR